jgi:hypothetical protein
MSWFIRMNPTTVRYFVNDGSGLSLNLNIMKNGCAGMAITMDCKGE